MWPSVRDWVDALYIIVPAYCTNGAPIIFGGGPPIDRGKSLPDGQRIFGDHKTLGGFVAGLVVGSIVGIFGYYLFAKAILPLAILASLGALVGDLTGAFVKRRMGMKPGAPFPGLDQLDFVLGALLVVYPFYEISLVSVLIVLFVTPPIHLVMNICAYRLGLKSSFW